MWAFIYSGVFIAALIIGVVSKFVQPSWTKDFTAAVRQVIVLQCSMPIVKLDKVQSFEASVRLDKYMPVK